MVKIYLFRLKIKNGDKMYEEIKDKTFEHKHALIFVGGIAAAMVGKKILESKTKLAKVNLKNQFKTLRIMQKTSTPMQKLQKKKLYALM